MAGQRAQWGSRLGFILAAAGSAVGLGNIWKFPYITGENGGGLFVLIYLACIAFVGLPIMMAEIFIGRAAQSSPVGAFRKLSKPRSPWMGIGWMGVVVAFIILSYYSVVAGWAMHYTWISLTDSFTGKSPEEISNTFTTLFESAKLNLFWHTLFMAITIAIVMGGIRRGIELCSKILMPTLFLLLLILLAYAMTTDGFGEAFTFLFSPNADKLTSAGVLEALGHSFFTLSLGMGAMITYGSYLKSKDDIVTASITVSVLDTAVALIACLILFPIIFSVGREPSAGPGLVFISIPIAFAQMPGGAILAPLFFLLLTFAALTSAISLLEVAVSYFIDERGWIRAKATLTCGITILVVGIPSALSGGTKFFGEQFQTLTSYLKINDGQGFNWFEFFDYVATNWMLPIGGLGIALFAAWRVGNKAREEGFKAGTKFGKLYWGWVFLLRYIVPIAVLLVFLNAIGVLDMLGLTGDDAN